METGDRYEPYRLIDPDGVTIEAVAVCCQELPAVGKAPSTVRSYGMDLLRWWRFLQAVDVSWDRATRLEARGFSCWIQKGRQTQEGQGPEHAIGSGRRHPEPGDWEAVDRAGARFDDRRAQRDGAAPVLRRAPRRGGRPATQPVPVGSFPPLRAGSRAPQPDGRLEA
ncbi:site-specific integrase [Streptomyces sp. NPDC088252]|uniref:site-specific integrase n=1 Tax=Streptomyces sp. NPDC088252 TaxID=3365845 RepID=UPI0037FD356B